MAKNFSVKEEKKELKLKKLFSKKDNVNSSNDSPSAKNNDVNNKGEKRKNKNLWWQIIVFLFIIGGLITGIAFVIRYDFWNTSFNDEFSKNISMQITAQAPESDDGTSVSIDDEMYILRSRIDPLNNQNIYMQERYNNETNHILIEADYYSYDYFYNLINQVYATGSLTILDENGMDRAIPSDSPTTKKSLSEIFSSVHATVDGNQKPTVYLEPATSSDSDSNAWNDIILGDDSSKPTQLFLIANIGQLINGLRGDFWRYDELTHDVWSEYSIIIEDFFKGPVLSNFSGRERMWFQNDFLSYKVTPPNGSAFTGNFYSDHSMSKMRKVMAYGPQCFEWNGQNASYDDLLLQASPEGGTVPDNEKKYLKPFFKPLESLFDKTDDFGGNEDTVNYFKTYYLNYDDVMSDDFDVDTAYQFNVASQADALQISSNLLGGIAGINYSVDWIQLDDPVISSQVAEAMGIVCLIAFSVYFVYLIAMYRLSGFILTLNTILHLSFILCLAGILQTSLGLTSLISIIIPFIILQTGMIFLFNRYKRERYSEKLLPSTSLKIAVKKNLPFILDSVVIMGLFGFSLFWLTHGIFNIFAVFLILSSLLGAFFLLFLTITFIYIFDKVNMFGSFKFFDVWNTKSIIKNKVYAVGSQKAPIINDTDNMYTLDKPMNENRVPVSEVMEANDLITSELEKPESYLKPTTKKSVAKSKTNKSDNAKKKLNKKSENYKTKPIIESKLKSEKDEIAKSESKNKSKTKKSKSKESFDYLIEVENDLEIIQELDDFNENEENLEANDDGGEELESNKNPDPQNNDKDLKPEDKDSKEVKKQKHQKPKKAKKVKESLVEKLEKFKNLKKAKKQQNSVVTVGLSDEDPTSPPGSKKEKTKLSWYKMANFIPIVIIILVGIAGIMFACNATKIDDSLLSGTNFVFLNSNKVSNVEIEDFDYRISTQMKNFNEFNNVVFESRHLDFGDNDSYEIDTNINSRSEARHFLTNVLTRNKNAVAENPDAVEMLYTIPKLEWDSLVDIIIALAITLAVIFIYVIFRLDWSYFITIFIVAISVLLSTLSLSMILQLSLSFSVVVAFLAATLFSFSYSVLVSSRLNQFRKQFNKDDYNNFFRVSYEFKSEIRNLKDSIKKRIKHKALKIRIKTFMARNGMLTNKQFKIKIKEQYAMEMSRKELRIKIKEEMAKRPKINYKKMKKDIRIKWNEGITEDFIKQQKEKIKFVKQKYKIQDQEKNLLYKTADLTIKNLLWFNIGISVLFAFVFITLAFFFSFSLFLTLLIGLLLSIWLPFLLGIPIWVKLEKIRSFNNVKLNKYLDIKKVRIDEQEVKGIND